MAKQFSCMLIGSGSLLTQCAAILQQGKHKIAGIISSNPEVSRWASERDVPCVDPAADVRSVLQQAPFDYRFSIINHSVTAPEVLRLPRLGAINYHDSPLPKYAGFNVTSWAILN